MMESSNLVQEGDQVVFMRRGSTRVFQVRKNRQVYFERNKFHVEELIGQPYGTTYEMQKGKLIKVVGSKLSETGVDANVSEPTGDNRNLQDLDSNQKMSREDIMELKGKGLTGEEIIGELIENSETFHNKTEFSKAKYLKKKKKRHILSFTVMRPTPRLIIDLFAKEPGKICNLRPDTLSQLLSYSNVMYGSHVAVVETCHGLIMASVLQRLGGKGKLIQLIPNASTNVNRKAMEYFSFTNQEMSNVYSFHLDALSSLKKAGSEECSKSKEIKAETDQLSTENISIEEKETSENAAAQEEAGIEDDATPMEEEQSSIDKESKSADDPIQKEVSGMDVDASTSTRTDNANSKDGDAGAANADVKPWVSHRWQQRLTRETRHKEAAALIRSKNIDSLIIACKYNPVDIVKNMLEFMPPSKHVVVFCQFIDPLVTIYTYIKDNHLGLQIQLSETWLRDYQILPQRTHPMISMSGTGGYLLTFITCDG